MQFFRLLVELFSRFFYDTFKLLLFLRLLKMMIIPTSFTVLVLLCAWPCSSAGIPCNCNQFIDILMELYDGTNGPSWTSNTNWGSTSGGDMCSLPWFGVVCFQSTSIISISLPNNNLKGSLPLSWGALTALTLVNLSGNALVGALPTEWGNMTSLQTCDLSENQLEGALPNSWVNMTVLSMLFLNNNQFFQQSLPSVWGVATSALTTLVLSNSQLTGQLPLSWGNMTSLRYVDISSNSLIGSIPASWSALESLQTLCLQSNPNLGCQLPDSFALLTQLTTLYLQNNNFTGSLPPAWGSLTELSMLNLSSNMISGPLPLLWSGMTKLTVLLLNSNQLSGSLPAEWGGMVKLQHLDVSINHLSGTLPSPWWSLSMLTMLIVTQNSITGTLPKSWPLGLDLLASLYLNGNFLVGTVPTEWGDWMALGVLLLHNNCLRGMIPSTLTSISTIRICNTHLIPMNPACDYPRNWPFACNALSRSASETSTNSLSLSVGLCSASTTAKELPSTTFSRSSKSLTNFSFLRSSTLSSSGGTLTAISLHSLTHSSWFPSSSSSLSLASISTNSATAIQTSSPFQSPSMPMSTLTNTTARTTSNTSSWATATRVGSTTMDATNTLSRPTQTLVSASTTFVVEEWCNSSALHGITEIALTSVVQDVSASVSSTTLLLLLLPAMDSVSAHNISSHGNKDAPTTATFTSISIPRRTLRESPNFALNFSFLHFFDNGMATESQQESSSASRLAASGAALVAGDSALQLMWVLGASGLSSSTSSWACVVAGLPTGQRWVDETQTSVLRATTAVLRFTFSCNTTSTTATAGTSPLDLFIVTVLVPSPGVADDLAGQVTTATKYSQIVSILAGGASSGSALGRVLATRSMVLCSADAAVGGGVIDLNLHLCLETDGATGSIAARSAILSNLILLAAVSAVLLAFSFAWARFTCTQIVDGLIEFRLPSSLMIAWTATVPSTSAATTLLLARVASSSCTGLDVLLGLVGCAATIIPCALLLLVWNAFCRGPTPKWLCLKRNESTTSTMNETYAQWVYRSVKRHGLRQDWEWVGAGTLPAWSVLLEYRVLWYVAVDSGVLVVSAVLAVASGFGSASQCQGLTIVVMLLLALQCSVLMLLKPLTTFFSHLQSAVTLVLTFLSVLAQLLFIAASSNNPNCVSAMWLVDASAGCNLAVVGVSVVRMVLDAWETWLALRRRFHRLLLLRAELLLVPFESPLHVHRLDQHTALSNTKRKDPDPQRKAAALAKQPPQSFTVDKEQRLEDNVAPHSLTRETTEDAELSATNLREEQAGIRREDPPVRNNNHNEMMFWDSSGAAKTLAAPSRMNGDDHEAVLLTFQL